MVSKRRWLGPCKVEAWVLVFWHSSTSSWNDGRGDLYDLFAVVWSSLDRTCRP